MYLHPYFSMKKIKTSPKKKILDKKYANFVPYMTQQEEDLLNNQPTSVTAGFRKIIVDSIVHTKMQEFINQMGTFYKSPY